MTKQHHNYNNYSKPNPVVTELETTDTPVTPVTMENQEEMVTNHEVKFKEGTVIGNRLNVREKPNAQAKIVCVIDLATTVEIDEKKSTRNFYRVRLSDGTEGFCMKQYITV